MLMRRPPLRGRRICVWLYVRAVGSVLTIDPLWLFEIRQIAHGIDAWKEEVRPTCQSGERGQSLESSADWPLGNFEIYCAVLRSADRIVFVAELVKRGVIDPDVLGEFELPDQAGADDEGGDAAVRPVVGCTLGQRRPISGSPTNQSMPVHVVRRVSRVKPSGMCAQG